MLTEAQEKYMQKISETALADIKPWSQDVAEFAEDLINKLKMAVPGIEIYWSGSLALGISGLNDIDMTLFAKDGDFEKYLPILESILGEPQIKGPEKILWRMDKEGYHIDAYWGYKNSQEVRSNITFFERVKGDKNLLEEYQLLKEESDGLPLREYYKRKCEFYNKVLDIKS